MFAGYWGQPAKTAEALRPTGLTFARYELLMLLLFSREGRLPMGKARARLQVHPTSVTNAVDRLEAAGLVRREPHPTDRRATLVSFTERGARMAADFESGQHEYAAVLFDGMPDRRFDGLVQGLSDVLDRLRAVLAPAEAQP